MSQHDDLDDGYDDLDRDQDDECPDCGRVHCTCDDGRCDECEPWGEVQCSRHADVYIAMQRDEWQRHASRSVNRRRRYARYAHRAAAQARVDALAASARRGVVEVPYFDAAQANPADPCRWLYEAPAVPLSAAERALHRDMRRSTDRLLWREMRCLPRGRRR